MQKRIFICMLICLIFFSGFGISKFAQGQTDLKSLTDLVNTVFQNNGDLGQWRFTSSMVFPRVNPSAVISGDHIYVMGGFDGVHWHPPYGAIEKAQIQSDGTLGNWILETDTLLFPVWGAARISKNGYIYIIGGENGPGQQTTTVQYTQVNPDGSLQPWQQTSPLLQERAEPACAEYNGYIYVMGGSPSKGFNSVEYAKVNPDGTLGNWSYTSSNLLGRWYPSAQAYNGYVYLLGGYVSGANATVEYAKINPDGSLGAWNYTSSMTVTRSGWPGTAVLNGYLYAFSGADWKGALNTIEKAFINPDGTLGAWSLLPDTLLNGVFSAASGQNNGHVYLIGGHLLESYDDVQMTGVSFLIGGDANCDGVVSVSDIVYLINYLFIGGPPPGCL